MAEDDLSIVRRIKSENEDLVAENRALKGGGGGHTTGGMTVDWKTSVDTQLTQLHQDVRHLLYGVLAGVVLLAGAGWTAYAKVSDQITDMRVAQAQVSGKLDILIERTNTSPAKTAAPPAN